MAVRLNVKRENNYDSPDWNSHSKISPEFKQQLKSPYGRVNFRDKQAPIDQLLNQEQDDYWKVRLLKPKYENPDDEMPRDVLGNDLRNLRGIVKVNKKNEAIFNMNQKHFQNYYEMVGVPYEPPKNEFERKIRSRLMKRQEVPKDYKIGTKDFQPGYAAYQSHMRSSGQKIPIIGDNYRSYLQQMDNYNDQNQDKTTNLITGQPIPDEMRYDPRDRSQNSSALKD